MKGFLLDENVPGKLKVPTRFPVFSVSKVGRNPSDSHIWEYAKKHDLVIVTKDADFSERIILNSPPPRIVHLKIGNLRRSDFHQLISRTWPKIESALKTHKLINVYTDRLEGIG